MLFEPVVGVALAAWLLGEALVPIQLVGAVAILAAAVLLQRSAGDPGTGRSGDRPGRTVVPTDAVTDPPRSASCSSTTTPWSAGACAISCRCMTISRSSARPPTAPRRSSRRPALRPDVVVMDLVMPGVDGIDATVRIKAANPEVEIVAITSFIEEARIVAAIEAGAAGFLLKDAEADELAAAIRAAASGEVHLDPVVAGIVARRMRDRAGGAAGHGGDRSADALGSLTARERDVLAGIARGLSNRAIADDLGITERTARTHVSNILAKLGLSSRTQAALLAVQHGLERPT